MELSSAILSDIVVYTKYAKYLPEKFRRETWEEVVTRNKEMHLKKFPSLKEEIEAAYKFVYEKKVLPSMRSMQFAGKPMEVNPARQYNCSYQPMNASESFAELMFLLLSGVGVGYSVQKHHVNKLPTIKPPKKTRRFLVADSIEGWSDAVKALVRAYFEEKPLPVFDFSDIRPKGALLVTSGGKAPGPEPLKQCLQNIQNILDEKKYGEKLSCLEVHDICCYIADAVLAGGIRRSATICLFDLDNDEMINCKSNLPVTPLDTFENGDNAYKGYVEYKGKRHFVALPQADYQAMTTTGTLPWYYLYPARQRANNSAVILRHKIDKKTFMDFWKKIEDSQSGEPGFMFSNNKDFGLNPCGEVSLRENQFCNLATVSTYDVYTQAELNARVTAATFIATLQASYTNFHYLRDEWREVTEREALIGVSLSGIASGGVLKLDMEEAADTVKAENERVAKMIGINKAARATVVKPDGTSALVLGSSSGVHAWHDKYYIRRMRVKKNESIYSYLVENHPELVEDEFFNPKQDAVVGVPIKAPDGAITRDESALDLLERVSKVYNKWIKPGHRKGDNTNNVSCTVTVKDHEWKDVGEWMWKHRDEFTALSVLPADLGTYKQSPFESISKRKYDELFAHLKQIDLSNIVEVRDDTNLQGELACAGGACEV